MPEHAFFYVICTHKMITVCRPSDRDVNWESPVQGKPNHVHVKESYGNSNWLLVGQTECMVVNPITVNNFASLFNCTPSG